VVTNNAQRWARKVHRSRGQPTIAPPPLSFCWAALLSLTVQPVGDPVEASDGVVGEEGVGASH
jgi:hypothetical protein